MLTCLFDVLFVEGTSVLNIDFQKTIHASKHLQEPPLGHWKTKIQKPKGRPMVSLPVQALKKKRRTPVKKIIALSMFAVVIGVILWNAPTIYVSFTEFFQQPEINIDEKIEELQSQRKAWDKYSIRETDWDVYSRMAQDSGCILTKMYNWEDFRRA